MRITCGADYQADYPLLIAYIWHDKQPLPDVRESLAFNACVQIFFQQAKQPLIRKCRTTWYLNVAQAF